MATRSIPWRARARMAAICVSSTPGTDTADDVRCLSSGTASSAASARTHCSGSKPIGRTTTSSLATGSSSSSTSPASAASSDSIPAAETSSSSVSNQALPWPPNATANGSPAVRRSTRAWARCGPVPSWSADTRSCSWIVTVLISLYASVRIGWFGRTGPGPAGACELRPIPHRISAGKRLTGALSAGRPMDRAARRTASAL
ncbi:hypothetical protein I546_1845 [Mycobacterium kansasii 732]|nr:hypothetical protein I546_1845 [Mycobacterium kansasii 732]